jgi:5-methylcytosine-specific restriction protein A
MTPAERDVAYGWARAAFQQRVGRAEAVASLAQEVGIPMASASILVMVYAAMRRGAVFKRALAVADMERYLSGILQDEGVESLATALNALTRHIAYREVASVSQRSNRELLAKYLAKLASPPAQRPHRRAPEDTFDEEVDRGRADDADARRKRLLRAPRFPRRVAQVVFVFERNPDVVAEVLDRAQGKCGICGNSAPFLRASNETPYLEVHHRTPLAMGGEDTVENAVAACPNCHREQHYGKRTDGHRLDQTEEN